MLAGPASQPARRCRPRAVVAPGAARRPRPPRGPGAGSVLRHTSRPGPSRVRCVRLGPSRARSGHLRHMSSRARAGGTCPAATRAPGQLPAATRTATSPEGDRPGGRTLRPPWPGRAPPARRPGRSELGVLQFCVQRDERARDEVPRSPSVPPPKAHHPQGPLSPKRHITRTRRAAGDVVGTPSETSAIEAPRPAQRPVRRHPLDTPQSLREQYSPRKVNHRSKPGTSVRTVTIGTAQADPPQRQRGPIRWLHAVHVAVSPNAMYRVDH